MSSRLILFCLALFVSGAVGADDREVSARQAELALEQGNATVAERILNRLLAERPNDAVGFGLLGSVLDIEKRYPEAGAAYRRAMQLAPPSPELLNDYANHQLRLGDIEGASETLSKLVSTDRKQTRAAARFLRCLTANLKGFEAQ